MPFIAILSYMKIQTKENKNPKKWIIILCYLTVYIVWGSTYLFIRVAVTTIPPFYVVGLRFFGGGVFFLLLALASRRLKRLPTFKEFCCSFFLGFFLLLGGNGLVTVAEKNVDSYLVALILATTPVVVAFFDWLLIGKKISFSGIIGIFLGFGGVCTLLYNGSSFSMSFTPDILLVIGGLVSWAFATSLGHKLKVFPDIFVNTGIQMFSIGLICLLTLMLGKPSIQQLYPSFSLSSILGLLYLMIIGSAAFCAYNYLIHNEPAIRVVSYAFVNPIIATLLGVVVAKEKIVPFLFPGIILILCGLFIMLYGNLLFKAIKAKRKLEPDFF